MTDAQIRALGPAFAAYLRRFRSCFLQDRTAAHFHAYCKGLLSDLPRKSVEPIALAAGTAVRTLQMFLADAAWDHRRARDLLQRHTADLLVNLPSDRLGTVGVIDETSCLKKGDKTPGVQRQYLGCVGKVDNGIVTVHFGLTRGRFQTLLDGDLYLPKSWDRDRPRCQAAGIPDTLRYQSKWRIALDQLIRLDANGVRFDGLTFDEGYGSKVPFLCLLDMTGQRFVAEVPVSFRGRTEDSDANERADAVLTLDDARRGRRHRQRRETVADAWWRAASRPIEVRGHRFLLVVAVNERTAEVKYFVTNAVEQPLGRILQVAFRRATIEHGFRVAKQEAGLAHYEGRQYVGLLRHLVLALLVLGFVSVHTDRLRGEKPGGDAGASVPGVERALPEAAAATAADVGRGSRRAGDPLSPRAQCRRPEVSQKTAA
jgi:SRSO17 transposase